MRQFLLCFLFLSAFLMNCARPKAESIEIQTTNSIVKVPIVCVTGEPCSVSENELFTENGNSAFSFCDVRGNPSHFDGKIIRIKATYTFMIHGALLYGEECPKLGRSTEDTIVVGFNSEKDYEYIANINETPINIQAVGRFSVVEPSHKSDTLGDRTPYRFEIICLEKAEKKKSKL